MAGLTLHPSVGDLTGQEAGRGRGQGRDRNQIDTCSLVQAVVRCRDAGEHGRNASCEVTDDIDRSDQPRPIVGGGRGDRDAVGAMNAAPKMRGRQPPSITMDGFFLASNVEAVAPRPVSRKIKMPPE